MRKPRIVSLEKTAAHIMPFSDLKPLTARYVYQIWQKEWDKTILVCNKFHKIRPKLSDNLLSFYYTKKVFGSCSIAVGWRCFCFSVALRPQKPSGLLRTGNGWRWGVIEIIYLSLHSVTTTENNLLRINLWAAMRVTECLV